MDNVSLEEIIFLPFLLFFIFEKSIVKYNFFKHTNFDLQKFYETFFNNRNKYLYLLVYASNMVILMNHKKLFIPGPTEVAPEVLMEQANLMIGHRSAEYTELYVDIIEKVKKYFKTKQNATVLTSSGTLWMDITARNLVAKKALSAVNGAFSERMYKAIKNSGKEVDPLNVEWGKAVKPEMVIEQLSKGDYDVFTVAQNETSTGVRSPVVEIGKAIKKEFPDVTYVVDAVSSAGGDLILPDEIQSDLLFTSSQKCFALPPGLSIAIVSDAAIEKAKSVPGRGFYTDLVYMFDYYARKHQNHATPNVSLMYALSYQLDRMLKETPEGRYERHLAMAKYTINWANKHFEMFSEKGYESVTVSTIKNTLGKNIAELNKELGKRGYQISNGYGKLKEQTFRIGHMGEWSLDDVKGLIWHIEDIWGL